MDVLGKARRLEWRIAGTVEQAAKGLVRPAPREPLEIVHAILDAVEREIQHPRDRRFKHLVIFILD